MRNQRKLVLAQTMRTLQPSNAPPTKLNGKKGNVKPILPTWFSKFDVDQTNPRVDIVETGQNEVQLDIENEKPDDADNTGNKPIKKRLKRHNSDSDELRK